MHSAQSGAGRGIQVRDYTYHRLEIWRGKHDLSRDEAIQQLLDAVGATALTDGYGSKHRPPRDDLTHMPPEPPRDDSADGVGPELERRVCPNCRGYFDTGEESDSVFCSGACRRRHERGEWP